MRRNSYDLSHEHKLSADMGYLVPLMCEEVLPGDTFMGSARVLARVAPLVNPIMHKVEMRIHHWWVPNRILWSGWEKFITGEEDDFAVPTVAASSAAETYLMDHFGIYPQQAMDVNALPFRAYNMIWNNFYRDQDLTTERDEDDMTLARVSWEKDYFTVARPYPQQGDSVSVGFSAGQVPVMGIGVEQGSFSGTDPKNIMMADGSVHNEEVWLAQAANAAAAGIPYAKFAIQANALNGSYPNIYADLSQATGGIDINELRRSIALQRIREARAFYGERYIDYLRFLGVNPSSGMLDLPEFIGGGTETLNFSEVLATAEGTNTQVGDMFGHGIAGMRSRRYRKFFEEHGWFLSLLSVRPKTVYLQQVPKKFTRSDNLDFWQKEFEDMPWQAVTEQEIHYSGDPANIWGYVPRFEEYRHGISFVSGTFRNGPEKDWHYGRDFSTPPTLNASFIECTPTDRVYLDTSMPEILINGYNECKARRLIKRRPGVMDI